MQIGDRELRRSLSGKEYYVPKSWSFGSMSQEDFNETYKKTLDFILAYILPGIEQEEIERQLINFL